MATRHHYKQNQINTRALFAVASGTIENALNCKFLLDVEAHATELCTYLDQKCCIDYILEHDSINKGLAWRAQQYGNRNWKTITVRASRTDSKRSEITELSKLRDAIANKTTRPSFHVQAYFDDDRKLIGGAIVKTVDLIQLIDAGTARLHETTAKGGATFYAVDFAAFTRNNLYIKQF